MLTERCSIKELEAALLPPERISPFPKAEDRTAWEGLLPETRAKWIALAEGHADFDWPAIRAEDYARYWKDGDLSAHANPRFERRAVLGMLAIAECIEGKGRFLNQVINGIYAVCEETTWVPALHRLHTKNNMDECMPDGSDHMVELVTASTSDLLLWIREVMRTRLDGVSVRICARIEREVRARLLVPYMERDDYWWMGFLEGVRVNNWNPWCNSSALMGFLLLEDRPKERAAAVAKVMRSLDAFIATYPADGCCDEGPGYWGPSGGGLYVALELLKRASSGRVDAFGEPLVRDIGRYIYKTHIHDRYFVDFADGDVKPLLGGDVIYRYGKSIGDDAMTRLGAILPEAEQGLHIWFEMYAHLQGLFQERERLALGAGAPYVRDAWLPVTQVMTAREHEGTERGLFLAAKGGHNAESHNHNDVGSFMVFADGYPLLVDLGTEEYKAQTFGPDRYELWYLQSRYHNLPTVREAYQRSGAAYRAKDARYGREGERSWLSLDVADAYPPEAGIESWRRTFVLERGAQPFIEVADEFRLEEPTGDIYFSLMTPCRPIVEGDGRVRLEYAAGRFASIVFEADALDAAIEPVDWMESRLRRNWGDRMHRIVLRVKGAVSAGNVSIRIETERSGA